jgi:hypothetical protein
MGKKLIAKVWMAMGAVVMVLGIAPSARAGEEVVARVPFDFIVAGQRMPAGKYVVTQNQTLVSIASTDRRHFAFVLMNPTWSDQARTAPRLVFERIGDDHFLAQVVPGGKGAGSELLLTPEQMERQVQRVEVASVR